MEVNGKIVRETVGAGKRILEQIGHTVKEAEARTAGKGFLEKIGGKIERAFSDVNPGKYLPGAPAVDTGEFARELTNLKIQYTNLSEIGEDLPLDKLNRYIELLKKDKGTDSKALIDALQTKAAVLGGELPKEDSKLLQKLVKPGNDAVDAEYYINTSFGKYSK